MAFAVDCVTLRSNAQGPEDWAVVGELPYDGQTERFVIPDGFITDLASVPRVFTWLIPRYGIYTLAAILHDFLCRNPQLISRRDADGLFRRVLRELGVSWPRRWMMWTAVRAASGMSDATGKEWLQFVAVAVPAVLLLAAPVLIVQVWVLLFGLFEWAGRSRT